MPTPVHPDVLKFGSDMLQFTSSIEKRDTPDAVLDGLHKVTFPTSQLNVLGAALFPLRWGDWSSLEKGKTVFLVFESGHGGSIGPTRWTESYDRTAATVSR